MKHLMNQFIIHNSCLPAGMASFIITSACLIALCSLPYALCSQGVGIGTTTPHPSAALDISSDTSGILIPRMTAAQRDAINSPEVGLMVFVTNDMRFYCYEGSDWEKVGGDQALIVDADGDTKIQVEEGTDDDTIRFDMSGTEYFKMANGRLEVLNTGGSVFIGRGTGTSDDLTDNLNAAIGDSALASNTTGQRNIAVGNKALYSNTLGEHNTASGNRALYSNTDGSHNTASGSQALQSNTSGFNNTALGSQALQSNTTGKHNTASGFLALHHNTSGHSNTASGFAALYENTTGFYNTASGYNAMQYNTTGIYNIAMGYHALRLNSTGKYNTALGSVALEYNSTGSHNTALGHGALLYNSTGFYNTGSGHLALRSNITGFRNVALGAEAGYNSLGDSSVYIGNKAGYFETEGNRLYIENSAADSANALIYGEFDNNLLRINGRLIATLGLNDADGDTKIQVEESTDDDMIRFDMKGKEYFRMAKGRLEVVNTGRSVFLGQGAGASDDLSDNDNVAVGQSALTSNTNGFNNMAIGFNALRSNTTGGRNVASGSRALYSNTSGYDNMASGYEALYGNKTGDNNIAVGSSALWSNQTGSNNTAVGYFTLPSHKKNDYNTAIGSHAMFYDTSGFNNTAVGRKALYQNRNAQQNTAVGALAMENNTVGDRNTGIGRRALQGNTTGADNTGLGNDALISNQTGSRNVALGTAAGYSSTGDSSIYIGNKAGYFETDGNRLYIENSNATSDSALIYGEFDNNILAFNAQVGIGTTNPDNDLHVIGNALLRDTLRATLTLQTDNNNKDVGLAFRRQADNYAWNIYRDGSNADLVFSAGNDSDIYNLTEVMRILDNGRVGIGTDNPDRLLTVNGDASKSSGGTSWSVFSDQRLKNVEGTYDRGLEVIMQLQPVFYRYKADNPVGLQSKEQSIGFVAQEVQKVIPEAIDSSGEYLSLHADPIYLAMLNSIKELKTENDALKAELSHYQNDVEARLRALEKGTAVASRK